MFIAHEGHEIFYWATLALQVHDIMEVPCKTGKEICTINGPLTSLDNCMQETFRTILPAHAVRLPKIIHKQYRE
jgi:hypothetical protein